MNRLLELAGVDPSSDLRKAIAKISSYHKKAALQAFGKMDVDIASAKDLISAWLKPFRYTLWTKKVPASREAGEAIEIIDLLVILVKATESIKMTQASAIKTIVDQKRNDVLELLDGWNPWGSAKAKQTIQPPKTHNKKEWTQVFNYLNTVQSTAYELIRAVEEYDSSYGNLYRNEWHEYPDRKTWTKTDVDDYIAFVSNLDSHIEQFNGAFSKMQNLQLKLKNDHTALERLLKKIKK